MKYIKFIKNNFSLTLLLLVVVSFAACDKAIQLSAIDESAYTTVDETIAFVVDAKGKRASSQFELSNDGELNLYLSLSKGASNKISTRFKIDKALLDEYNLKNETSYEIFPEDLISFDNEGIVDVESGENKSKAISIRLKSNESLKEEGTYVIPVGVELMSGNVKLSSDESSYFIFVKDLSKLADCNKENGIKIISCMEVNDTNPLNNLSFRLKGSGKYLIDMVILFSANINYNAETGRVFVYNNPNVQHILDNRDKYLKPLQDRGMKVVLGILGNHDNAGVAHLSDDTAKDFAQELRTVCDSYQLDGVFFDDEYSKPSYPLPPGFVRPTSSAASRLCYETKQALGKERLVCVYAYSTTYSLPPVDGVQSGDFVDYGIHDYGSGSDLSRNYPGLSKSGMALYSQEFNLNRYAYRSNLKQIRDGGYGAHMIFAMDPNRHNFRYQKSAMERLADVFYDDELVFDNKIYKKDW